MDLLEGTNTQSLANSLHEFLKYQKCLQWFNEAENEHKDLSKQQRFGFVVKHFKEFDMVNEKKIETIKWDWNPLCILYIKATVWCLSVTRLSVLHNPVTDSMAEPGGQCRV
jgi:hypothetical protein